MSKKVKYFLSSLISAIAFYLYLSLPIESRYFGLMLLVVLVTCSFWFGLGIVFEGSIDTKIMAVLLPVLWAIGFGLFSALLPNTWLSWLILSFSFGMVIYGMFLAENVFLVAIGYKTVPLYRAAFTVSLILTLLTAFFIYDSMLSFKMPFWGNMGITFILGVLLFNYQYWAIAIELPDDGKGKGKWPYVLVPALLLTELMGVLSFWPVGIFKGSIYLVAAIYVISALLQAEIRDRLFKRVVVTYSYMGVAIVLAILLATRWG